MSQNGSRVGSRRGPRSEPQLSSHQYRLYTLANDGPIANARPLAAGNDRAKGRGPNAVFANRTQDFGAKRGRRCPSDGEVPRQDGELLAPAICHVVSTHSPNASIFVSST
jgi:hypothetical protein